MELETKIDKTLQAELLKIRDDNKFKTNRNSKRIPVTIYTLD